MGCTDNFMHLNKVMDEVVVLNSKNVHQNFAHFAFVKQSVPLDNALVSSLFQECQQNIANELCKLWLSG